MRRSVDQPLVINQVELNLLHAPLIDEGIMANQAGVGSALAAGMLDYCRLHDMLVQAWSPVAGGKLFNPPDDAEERVKGVCSRFNST